MFCGLLGEWYFLRTPLLSFFMESNSHEQAYLLTDNYKHYSDLIEERDFLLYEFSRKISLDRINRWAQHNEFDLANGEIVLAFENGKVEPSAKEKVLEANIFARFSRRLFNLPEGPEALAEDTE